MNKTIKISLATLALVFSLGTTSVLAHTTSVVEPNTTSPALVDPISTPSTSSCTVNNKPISCQELGNKAKVGFGAILVFLLIALLGTIFWFVMLIHAITKPISDKPLWIIILLLTHLLGAIIYYFTVKRPYDKKSNGSHSKPVAAA